jgi:hypothetical protein
MVNLLEAMLSGGKLKRQDTTHLSVPRRPLPTNPRQLMELFGAMGVAATFQGLIRGVELKGADPHQIAFIALGRWPTTAELAALEDPYEPKPHLFGLLRSDEFRAHFIRRICDGFPERQRILFVRIPRSAGQNVLTTIDLKHPLLPADFAAPRYRNPVTLATTLGHVFSRLAASNALAMSQPHMSAFTDIPESRISGPDPLAWGTISPACRLNDLLFAIMRDPTDRAMGQINALLGAYNTAQLPVPPDIMARMDLAGRSPRLTDWRALGCAILAETLLPNPICHALGDGTAEGALQACARSPIRLVALDQYKAWGRGALDSMPADPVPAAETILRAEDLSAADRDIIQAATIQDRILYARFTERLKAAQLPAIPGRQL